MNRYLKKLRGYILPSEVREKLNEDSRYPEDEETIYGSNLPKDIPMESGIIQSVIWKIKK